MAEAMSEVEQEPLNQSKVEEKRSNPPSLRRSRSPHRKDQADQDQQVEEPPKPEQQDSSMGAEAKSLGRHLMETLTSASKSLLECSEKLEKNVVLLEECRADSSSIQSLAAGVNYYASTTKASQAAASAQHKQIAWDWLSDPKERQPLKDTLKSARYQCECTSKAAYQVVEVSKEILEELRSHKETMTEQTRLLKLIAGNQVELSKLMKGPQPREVKDKLSLERHQQHLQLLLQVEGPLGAGASAALLGTGAGTPVAVAGTTASVAAAGTLAAAGAGASGTLAACGARATGNGGGCTWLSAG